MNQVYADLLGRVVDPGGVTFWVNALSVGASREQVVQGITASLEYRRLQVDGIFRTILRRPADGVGLDLFSAALANGATVDQVRAGIFASLEYFQRTGSTVDAYVESLYQDVLGRGSDPGGKAVWTGALNSGIDRGTVAALFVISAEQTDDQVQRLYQEFLHRAADPGGLNHWSSLLRQGRRQEEIIAALVGSEEYFGNL